MKTNIVRLSESVKEPKSEKERKVIVMPNLFTNLLRAYKQKQDELKQQKINALYKETFAYFFDLLYTQEILKELQGIEIPIFLKKEELKKLAQEQASKEILKVINENRIDKCFKQLRQYRKQREAAFKRYFRG